MNESSERESRGAVPGREGSELAIARKVRRETGIIAAARLWLLRASLYLFTVVFGFSLLLGQESGRRSIRVHGESQVSAEPDQAEMDIGVDTLGANLNDTSTLNTQRVQAVIRSLGKLLPAANIKTVNFSINPNYRYAKEGPPSIEGYLANNTVRVMIDDLSLLRKVIEAATKEGATSVNRLNFTLLSESELRVRAKALAQAASQAEANAQALATSLQLKLGRVLTVEEGQPLVISPAPQIDLGKAQSSDMMPISPGFIQVHANVNLVYELVGNGRRSKQ